MKMEKIETKTQEVILLFVVVGVLSILFTGGIYLNLSEQQLTTLTGNIGLAMLDFMFSSLGYATFFVALSMLQIGKFLLRNLRSIDELKSLYLRVILKLFSEAAIIFLVASIFTVFQSYMQFVSHDILSMGAGGNIGILIGGNLYSSFGIYGALTILLSSLTVTMIVTGNLQLVSMYYSISEHIKLAFIKLLYFIKTILLKSTKAFLNVAEAYIPESIFVPIFKNVWSPALEANTNESVNLIQDSVKVFDSSKIPPIPQEYQATINDPIAEKVIGEPIVESGTVKKKVTKRKARKKTAPVVEDQVEEDRIESANPGEISQSYKKRYNLPSASHLKVSVQAKAKKKTDIENSCRELEERLKSFAIDGKVVSASVGSRLTMYEFQPAPGVRLNKITGLSDDLALMLGANSIRLLAPIPGKTTVGIEIPNKKPDMVNMGDMLKPLKKMVKTMNLPIAVGKDVYNNTIIQDISKMPHMMVSGTTGSGKSVFINNLIVSLLYTQSPKNLRFLMIDPKMIELSPYNGIPHLLKPVVTDLDEAKDLLVWAQDEMDRRYGAFADVGARDLNSFNSLISESDKKLQERKKKKSFDWKWEALPQIVIIVDELADLMITKGKEVEVPITRIAQKARAAGIHLVIATQRPSAEVVTGLIKTNFPTRVAFKVSSSIDSRTILDSSGAEKLLGNGDMLYMANGKNIERYQAAFISEDEVRKLVNDIQN